jgi:Domain of unknown function (DUF4365)
MADRSKRERNPNVRGKRVRPNRPVERAAVRAVTAIFEDANFLVQPVDGGNDIGKDLYVDITEADRATGELIAVQVKGGVSYRRKRGYGVPCSPDDLELWASSTVPIFGVVHDPEKDDLHWVNLTSWARVQASPPSPMEAPVDATFRLDSNTLGAFVLEARSFLAASGPPALVGLADSDPEVQRAAIYDSFALGRRDPRPLLLLRAALRYMSDRETLRLAISVLTLCVPHPDILRHAGNWIEERVRKEVRDAFDWSYQELCQLLSAADPEEYERGGVGQSVHAVVWPFGAPVPTHLKEVVLQAPREAALPALMMLVEGEGDDALAVLDRLAPGSAALKGEPLVQELRLVLGEHDYVSMY